MHRRTTLKALAVPFVAAALALTACSSGGGSGSTPTASGGATGSPIKIGLMCSCSGPFAGSDGGNPQVTSAWVSSVNAAGGINGHPVQVVVADDAGDATKSQQLVRKLVEQDKVMAIVDEVASYDATWADYVSGKGVPVLAGVSFTVPMANNADFFPTGSNLAVQTYGMVQLLQKAGKSKVAVLACAEAPLCDGYSGQMSRIAKAVGTNIQVVYSSKISATQASYTAQCLAAKSQGADSMYVGHGGAIVMRVIDQCAQQGYKPFQVQSGGDDINDYTKDANLNGMQISALHQSLYDTTSPGAVAFHTAIDKYSPKLKTASNYSGENISTWTGLALFQAAAKAGNITPTSTGADVKRGLYALKDETLGGLTPPLNYVSGKPTTIDCYFVEGLDSNKFTQPNGATPTCMSADVAAKVHAAFSGS